MWMVVQACLLRVRLLAQICISCEMVAGHSAEPPSKCTAVFQNFHENPVVD